MTSSDPQHDPLSALNNLADGQNEALEPADPDQQQETQAVDPLAAAQETEPPVAGPAQSGDLGTDAPVAQPRAARPKPRQEFDMRWVSGGAFTLMGVLLFIPFLTAIKIFFTGEAGSRAAGLKILGLVAGMIGFLLLLIGGLRLSQAIKAAQGRRRSESSAE